jgi:hypothetical protein
MRRAHIGSSFIAAEGFSRRKLTKIVGKAIVTLTPVGFVSRLKLTLAFGRPCHIKILFQRFDPSHEDVTVTFEPFQSGSRTRDRFYETQFWPKTFSINYHPTILNNFPPPPKKT